MKKLFKNMKQSEKGFTLIELIVVIAIIGILAAVLLPKFSGFTDSARLKAVTAEAKSVYTAYAACQAEGVVTDGTVKAYLGKMPKDADGKADLVSLGIVDSPAAGATAATYTTGVSGKKYLVTIKEGGDTTVVVVK